MDSCDVLIVGGGPAGSACARALRQAGLDVLVVDRARFPRDKVCAGWITPQVVEDLELDTEEYRRGRTFQPITTFHTAMIGSPERVDTAYDHPVSFGIRRCEFDDYLLRRSGARVRLGTAITAIERESGRWVINGSIAARMLVGAGGHACPVARLLNPALDRAPVVAAQEAEFPIDPADAENWNIRPGAPELYFSRDLSGYGWCFRKGEYDNIGLGLLQGRAVPAASAAFVAFLRAHRRIPTGTSWRWKGHAYLVAEHPRRRAVDTGVVLIGDAAGVAYPQSGEGIRPAIESGLLAAWTIVRAAGRYSRERLEPYERMLGGRSAPDRSARTISSALAPAVISTVVPWLFGLRWFTRHLLLDRWFLRAHEPARLRL
jgi:menaquinone-9 beta-reductase